MFRLGIDADDPAALAAFALREIDHLVERRDRELAVVFMRARAHPLTRPQRFDLGEGEVLGEPAADRLAVDGLRPPAIGEAHRHVGGLAELMLVARDQHAVLRRHEVGLDVVGAHLDRQTIRLERVFGTIPARAAMRDHERARRLGHRHGGGQDKPDDGESGPSPQQFEPELDLTRIERLA